MPIQERYIQGDEVLTDGSLRISPQNRAFKYGDGLFETILVRHGKVVALDLHLQRLIQGAKTLGLEGEAPVLEAQATALVERLLKGQDDSGFGRMRIMAYRADGGTYFPSSDATLWTAELRSLASDPWDLHAPKRLCISYDHPLHHSPLSEIKTLNALTYILAARQAASRGYDDALLRSPQGEVAELSAANIFVVLQGTLYTPRLTSGCLPGTMRARVLAAAHALGLEAHAEPIYLPLQHVTEAFCTNAISGLQPIAHIEDSDYEAHDFPVMMQLREAISEL